MDAETQEDVKSLIKLYEDQTQSIWVRRLAARLLRQLLAQCGSDRETAALIEEALPPFEV